MSRGPHPSLPAGNGSPASRPGSAAPLRDERQPWPYPPVEPAGESARSQRRNAATAEESLEAVDAPLRELEEQRQQVVPVPTSVPVPRMDGELQAAPAQTHHDALTPSRRDPEPVNAALRQADLHAA
ncbi:hypothetical protein GCM10010358_81640 [Streptomyces minutiscleroticus]|uniref:Uncharacterized protein n=1 Tax=Streptomyces minutiscleroticus TaxID=68238 RepID=A0A918P3B8_9ACTN|nr:hypothetical protein [Streptomyces minutiscleroticus]GGY17992.1 hypothetical protein GCM10010358_81640 [Streptomyces minutiscleroticus]